MHVATFLLVLVAAAQQACAFAFVPSPASPLQMRLRPQRDAPARCATSVLSLAAQAQPPRPSSKEKVEEHAVFSAVRRVSCAASALVLLPLSAAASDGDEDKRVLYTAVYTVAHLPVVVPFLLFWKVDKETKIKGAAVATPFFVAWIALLGGWLRY